MKTPYDKTASFICYQLKSSLRVSVVPAFGTAELMLSFRGARIRQRLRPRSPTCSDGRLGNDGRADGMLRLTAANEEIFACAA